MPVLLNGNVALNEEQPGCGPTTPMAQESVATNNQHQPKDSAEPASVEVVLAPAKEPQVSAQRSAFLPAMTMEIALARRAAIVEFVKRLMVRDQDFGEIPGTAKPTLLKPGAEKLCNFFGLEPEFTPIVEDLDWAGAQHGGEAFCYARYRCRLLREGRVVGVGEGSWNSWEAKYRYRWVPEDRFRSSSIAADSSSAPRAARCSSSISPWSVGKQPGNTASRTNTGRSSGTPLPRGRGKSIAWEIDLETASYRVPNPDIADVVNTIQKMAQKRALVAATLIATSASEFFTQDVEDSDPYGRRIDTGPHPHGTREAQEYVRDRKLEELRAGAHRFRMMHRGSRGGTSARCGSASTASAST